MSRVRILFGLMLALIGSSSFAASSLGDLAVNLTIQLPPYIKMISSFSYLMGVMFVISGVLKVKQHKEAPQSHSAMAGPLFVMMGVFLIYLPTTVHYLYASIFGDDPGETGMDLYAGTRLIEGAWPTPITSVPSHPLIVQYAGSQSVNQKIIAGTLGFFRL